MVRHDHGRHPDCQFTSFIHATKKTVPGLDDIMWVRRGCKNWLLNNPSPLVESDTDWRDQIKVFGFTKKERKQGNEHSLCGLTGAFAPSINVIIVTTSGHRTVHYNPPNNRPYSHNPDIHFFEKSVTVISLIYVVLEHTRQYLSTTQNPNTAPRIITPSTGGTSGISAGTRRATVSTELTNDPTPPVVSSPQIPVPALSVETSSNSQGISQDPQTVSEDIFANIQYV